MKVPPETAGACRGHVFSCSGQDQVCAMHQRQGSSEGGMVKRDWRVRCLVLHYCPIVICAGRWESDLASFRLHVLVGRNSAFAADSTTPLHNALPSVQCTDGVSVAAALLV